jgi:FHA domain
MGKLTLTIDGKLVGEYQMDKERYTIGRLPDNDIPINHRASSGHHALIINILNDSFLEDLNSTNGTYVNGKIVKKHALQEGDVITIGQAQMRYETGVGGGDDDDEDDFEKTMIIRPGSSAQAGAPSMDTVNKALEAAGGQAISDKPATALPTAKLQVLSGPFAGKELVLTKALTTLGRPGVQVAAVTRRADGYFIVHVEGGPENRQPVVNGNQIGTQALKLENNDTIELAGVKMGFIAT